MITVSVCTRVGCEAENVVVPIKYDEKMVCAYCGLAYPVYDNPNAAADATGRLLISRGLERAYIGFSQDQIQQKRVEEERANSVMSRPDPIERKKSWRRPHSNSVDIDGEKVPVSALEKLPDLAERTQDERRLWVRVPHLPVGCTVSEENEHAPETKNYEFRPRMLRSYDGQEYWWWQYVSDRVLRDMRSDPASRSSR